jgi:phosphotransferase system enzyme I (PtsP)
MTGNAAGIGLFRTEILFMVAPTLPRASTQEALYRSILTIAASPVTFRTLDIGGDKVLPYLRKWRRRTRRWAGAPSASASTGLRCCALQFRALIAAGGDRDLRIMLPMVATASEFDAAQTLLERERPARRHSLRDAPRRGWSSASCSRCPRCSVRARRDAAPASISSPSARTT